MNQHMTPPKKTLNQISINQRCWCLTNQPTNQPTVENSRHAMHRGRHLGPGHLKIRWFNAYPPVIQQLRKIPVFFIGKSSINCT